MTRYHLAVEMPFASTAEASDQDFEQFLDDVLTHFEKIDRPVNLSARFSDRTADFAAFVEAPDFETAVNTFLVEVRTALHAAGCGTAGWARFAPLHRTVRELQDA